MDKPEPTTFHAFHTLAYHVLIRPGQVWKISKYFLRRWSAYLTPSEVWLIIGARQFSYFNDREPWFEAYDIALARAAGLHVKVYRRTIKQEIVAGAGPIAAFIARRREGTYRRRNDITRQTAAEYTIRLDDPLTPGDANHLADMLRRTVPPNVRVDDLIRILDNARHFPPERLHAPDLAPVQPQREGLHSVADIIEYLFPHLAGEYSWREAAEALHLHITSPDLAHYDTQYFRMHWLPILGPGPALLLIHLRSLCYYNEDTAELRDHIHLNSGELEQRLQISNRTLRRWFDRLDEISAEQAVHLGPFLRRLETRKLSNQQVAYQFWVNVKTPIAPVDHSAYEHLLTEPDNLFPTLPSNGNGNGHNIPHTAPAGGQQVPHTLPADGQKVVHTLAAAGQQVPHTPPGNGQIAPHTPPPNGQPVPHTPPGDGQQMPGRRTNGAPLKPQKTPNGREKTISNQQQIPASPAIPDPTPAGSLAAAAGPLPTLLEQIGIQQPTRGRLLQLNPPLETVVAWRLYAAQENGLQRPLPYIVNRLTAGDPPPEPFLRLARLGRDQWRDFAAAAHYRHRLAPDQWQELADSDDFTLWLDHYGDLPPEDLPFNVGLHLDPPPGTGMMHHAPTPESPADAGVNHPAPPPGTGMMHHAPTPPNADPMHHAPTPESPADAGVMPHTTPAGTGMMHHAPTSADHDIWREACLALQHQMDPATYNAWLRDAVLLERSGPRFTIAVRNDAARQWVAGRLLAPIRLTLSALAGQPVNLEVTIAPT